MAAQLPNFLKAKLSILLSPIFSQAGFAPVLMLLLLVVAIGGGTYLVQQRTNFLPQAANETLTTYILYDARTCDDYIFNVGDVVDYSRRQLNGCVVYGRLIDKVQANDSCKLTFQEVYEPNCTPRTQSSGITCSSDGGSEIINGETSFCPQGSKCQEGKGCIAAVKCKVTYKGVYHEDNVNGQFVSDCEAVSGYAKGRRSFFTCQSNGEYKTVGDDCDLPSNIKCTKVIDGTLYDKYYGGDPIKSTCRQVQDQLKGERTVYTCQSSGQFAETTESCNVGQQSSSGDTGEKENLALKKKHCSELVGCVGKNYAGKCYVGVDTPNGCGGLASEDFEVCKDISPKGYNSPVYTPVACTRNAKITSCNLFIPCARKGDVSSGENKDWFYLGVRTPEDSASACFKTGCSEKWGFQYNGVTYNLGDKLPNGNQDSTAANATCTKQIASGTEPIATCKVPPKDQKYCQGGYAIYKTGICFPSHPAANKETGCIYGYENKGEACSDTTPAPPGAPASLSPGQSTLPKEGTATAGTGGLQVGTDGANCSSEKTCIFSTAADKCQIGLCKDKDKGCAMNSEDCSFQNAVAKDCISGTSYTHKNGSYEVSGKPGDSVKCPSTPNQGGTTGTTTTSSGPSGQTVTQKGPGDAGQPASTPTPTEREALYNKCGFEGKIGNIPLGAVGLGQNAALQDPDCQKLYQQQLKYFDSYLQKAREEAAEAAERNNLVFQNDEFVAKDPNNADQKKKAEELNASLGSKIKKANEESGKCEGMTGQEQANCLKNAQQAVQNAATAGNSQSVKNAYDKMQRILSGQDKDRCVKADMNVTPYLESPRLKRKKKAGNDEDRRLLLCNDKEGKFKWRVLVGGLATGETAKVVQNDGTEKEVTNSEGTDDGDACGGKDCGNDAERLWGMYGTDPSAGSVEPKFPYWLGADGPGDPPPGGTKKKNAILIQGNDEAKIRASLDAYLKAAEAGNTTMRSAPKEGDTDSDGSPVRNKPGQSPSSAQRPGTAPGSGTQQPSGGSQQNGECQKTADCLNKNGDGWICNSEKKCENDGGKSCTNDNYCKKFGINDTCYENTCQFRGRGSPVLSPLENFIHSFF